MVYLMFLVGGLLLPDRVLRSKHKLHLSFCNLPFQWRDSYTLTHQIYLLCRTSASIQSSWFVGFALPPIKIRGLQDVRCGYVLTSDNPDLPNLSSNITGIALRSKLKSHLSSCNPPFQWRECCTPTHHIYHLCKSSASIQSSTKLYFSRNSWCFYAKA